MYADNCIRYMRLPVTSTLRSAAERLCHFDNLLRPGTNPIIFRQVHPPHNAGRIHQKLGRPGNVLPIDACAGVHQVIAANHVRGGISKKRIGVPGFLTQLTRGFGRVYADCHRANPYLCELIQTLLNAP